MASRVCLVDAPSSAVTGAVSSVVTRGAGVITAAGPEDPAVTCEDDAHAPRLEEVLIRTLIKGFC